MAAVPIPPMPPTPFRDLADFTALPRLAGLALSPDDLRLATTVSTPSPDGKKYVTALWEIDPEGRRPARRLTRSAPGESHPAFLLDGGLLFTSKRSDPDRPPETDETDRTERTSLWLLPAGGGEAQCLTRRPGDVGAVSVARDTGHVFFTADVLPGVATVDEDERRRKDRADAGVTAILHEGFPIRYWDHDLGAAEPHAFALGLPGAAQERPAEAIDLTPTPAGRLEEGLAASPDGRRIAIVRRFRQRPAAGTAEDRGGEGTIADRYGVEVIDVLDGAAGARRMLIEDSEFAIGEPAFSPDGKRLVCLREALGDWTEAPRRTVLLADIDSGEVRELLSDSPLWPSAPAFAADGTAVFFVSDEHGHGPVYRLDLTDATLTRLTGTGAYSAVVIARDGSALYALRSALDEPPTPVRLDPARADQDPVRLPAPGRIHHLPGAVTDISTTADDGVRIRAWLALPASASASSPVPLVVWFHGGPVSSWNAWSWRWNPWLLVERGYAVLLPDPALSSGYGHDFIQRGWGSWGARPFTDLMSITDAACDRDDVDASRTAAMGGSFGGYMANWAATQTDRFRAIVTHASLWHLDQFSGTTDEPPYWQREFGDPLEKPERYLANSPHLRVADIRTPMLVIHGDKDYRVPIGEALRLWYDLNRFSVPAKFLYFPDENHWVLTPGNATVWYETVLAFLAEHVLGGPWQRPALV